MKATLILLPLLGLTWVFGLLAVNENTAVFAWLFTIFNSLQVCFHFYAEFALSSSAGFLHIFLPCPKKQDCESFLVDNI